jgi:hypothetical protein
MMANNQENLAVTINEKLLLALRRKAAETNRSVSDLINEAIESGLAGDADREFLKESPGVAEDAASTEEEGYLAFISYSHADEKIAAATHKLLERFRVPRGLVGCETEHGKVPARIRPVFRDREEFPASADLGLAIRESLGAARTLVVICSPRSARSRWVGEEIRHFKQLGRSDRIYCLIADGEPVGAGEGGNDRASFHPALLEQFDDRGRQLEGTGAEPLAVDLSEDGLSIAGVKLAAGVLGVGYDDLYRRVRRQRLRNRSLLAGLTAMVLAAGTWLYVDGLREKRLNRAQQLAVEARQEVYTAQPLAGLALALHALAMAPRRDEAGRQTILETARDLATRGRVAWLGNNVENVIPSTDGSRLAVDHAEANGELRSGMDGALIQELSRPIYRAKFLDDAPGYLVADYRGQAELRLAASGARVAELKSPITDVTFGPDHFFVYYSGGHSNELRRIDDGALVPLAEWANPADVAFSRSPNAPLMAVRYFRPNQPPELRRTDDASLVTLTGNPRDIQLSPDIETGRILVTYEDAPAELLRTADLSLVWRFDGESGRVAAFVGDPGGQFLKVRRDGAVELLRSSDGSPLLTGKKIVTSQAKSHVAVLAKDRVEWFRSRDGERLGSVQGDFRKLEFSKDRPPSRLALQRSDGWELRRVEDGSLVHELSGAETVDIDAEFLFVRRQKRAEIRRLDDGSLVLSLGERATRVIYPSSGLVQVHLDDDSRELRRLSDGGVIKAPVNRTISSDTVVGPGLEYHLIRYVSSKSELKRSVDGTTVMRLGSPRADLRELTFIPESGPSHVLARYEDGSSSLIALKENGDTVRLPGTAVSIDLMPAEAPRYLIIRYDDGRSEIWRGLEDIRRLGPLETNLKGHSLADTDSALTVWFADGRADVLDIDWLEQATVDGITDERLFALACEGPLAGFDASELDDRLGGDTWSGCILPFGE